MKVIASYNGEEIGGVCESCGGVITFTRFENDISPYYEAEEIVNKWMDHQLNDCKSLVIDNPGGIS